MSLVLSMAKKYIIVLRLNCAILSLKCSNILHVEASQAGESQNVGQIGGPKISLGQM